MECYNTDLAGGMAVSFCRIYFSLLVDMAIYKYPQAGFDPPIANTQSSVYVTDKSQKWMLDFVEDFL